MKGNRAVTGVFGYLDDTLKALSKVKAAGLDFRAYSPFGCPEISEAADPVRSNVRVFTMCAAIFGCCFGFALAVWCSMDWPMRVSAKDVASIPAFVVIGYECTILIGGLFTLLALFHFCRLPDILRKVGYHPRFSDDCFGLVVGCEGGQVEDVKKTLLACGAQEVLVSDGL